MLAVQPAGLQPAVWGLLKKIQHSSHSCYVWIISCSAVSGQILAISTSFDLVSQLLSQGLPKSVEICNVNNTLQIWEHRYPEKSGKRLLFPNVSCNCLHVSRINCISQYSNINYSSIYQSSFNTKIKVKEDTKPAELTKPPHGHASRPNSYLSHMSQR